MIEKDLEELKGNIKESVERAFKEHIGKKNTQEPIHGESERMK